MNYASTCIAYPTVVRFSLGMTGLVVYQYHTGETHSHEQHNRSLENWTHFETKGSTPGQYKRELSFQSCYCT